MTETELADCKNLFGRPPVLSTEDQKQFDGILDKVIACLIPQDMIELMYIREFVEASWIISRLTRHSTLAIERGYRQSLQYHAQRVKILKARKEARAQDKADLISQAPRDVAYLIALEDNIIRLASDVDEILERKATELEHNRAIEKGILFQEQLDGLVTRATNRRNDALQQLDFYRTGLGELVWEETGKIVDAEFQAINPPEEAAPTLVPTQEANSNAVGPQNSSEPAQ